MIEEFKNPNLDTFVEELQNTLEESKRKIDDLVSVENKTYENFIIPISMVYDNVFKTIFPLQYLNSACTTDDIDNVYEETIPIVSKWSTEMGQREDVYDSYQEVYSSMDHNKGRTLFLERSIESMKNNGVGLEESIKEKLKEINLKLSELSNEFKKNLMDSTKSYKLRIDNKNDVSEFPEDELKRHEKTDEEGNTYWEFSLQIPSYLSYMRYGSNPQKRYELYNAYSSRAPENEDVIEKILKLREEKSHLLGYKDFTELSLSSKMADSSHQVIEFHNKINESVMGYYLGEKETLDDYISNQDTPNLILWERNDGEEVGPWDYPYFIRKYKESNFNYKEEELKPYFEQYSVLNGMFNVLNDLFNLEFIKVEDTYVWDDKVMVYDMYRNGEKGARVYFDLETRENKRGGAWMNNSQTGYKLDGEIVLPIAYITCNFTPSNGDAPSLLSHDEVHTLFHEMGHVLQHICSEVDDPNLSGIDGVEWDAVEWSSQFLELFVYEKDILQKFGKHCQTGETIPDELIEKINVVKNYRQASAIIRQNLFALFDMKIHMLENPKKEDVFDVLNTLRKDLKSEVPFADIGSTGFQADKFPCTFSHIFAGGYSAGYYSYKWAEVLSVDCFNEYKKSHGFCEKYYTEFLSKGSSLSSMELFKNLMDRDPNPNSLVEYYFEN